MKTKHSPIFLKFLAVHLEVTAAGVTAAVVTTAVVTADMVTAAPNTIFPSFKKPCHGSGVTAAEVAKWWG